MSDRALQTIEALQEEYTRRCVPLVEQGTSASETAYKTELDRLGALRHLLCSLSEDEVRKLWPRIKQLFYSAKSCPYCATSMRRVTRIADVEEDDDVLRVGENHYKIACGQCPVGLLALLRDYSHENGCHKMPEYKALKHARGNKTAALKAVDATIRLARFSASILTTSKHFDLDR